jgi:hypothetical protein
VSFALVSFCFRTSRAWSSSGFWQPPTLST